LSLLLTLEEQWISLAEKASKSRSIQDRREEEEEGHERRMLVTY